MKKLIPIPEFCSSYATGRTRAYELIRDGKIEAVKNGRRTLILLESADRWAESLPRGLSSSGQPEVRS